MGLLVKFNKLLQLLPNAAYRSALLKGTAAAVEHKALVSSLTFNSLIDIGANVGQFSLLVTAEKPGTTVHAFEPLEQSARKFQALLGHDSRIHLYQCAIGETDGNASLHVSNRADSSSLHEITARQSSVFPGTHAVGTQAVKMARLSSVLDVASLEKPVLVKIDVQGYELSVLRGMLDCIEHCGLIYVECSFMELYAGQALATEVIEHLRTCGFSLEGVYNLVYSSAGVAVQGDFLFRRQT